MLELSLLELIILCLKWIVAITCSLLIVSIPLAIAKYIYEVTSFEWNLTRLIKLFKRDDDNDRRKNK